MTFDLIAAIQKNDKDAKRRLFDLYYSRFAAIAARYAKSMSQANELLDQAFGNCYTKIKNHRFEQSSEPDSFIENEFINESIAYIKSIRSEYYVSSTVHPGANSSTKNYNLFENQEVIDFNNVEIDVLIQALQKIVPAQRLVFNLHVIDGFSLAEVASKLETSEETVKSNLEKARFNFQKNIEKQFKSQSVL